MKKPNRALRVILALDKATNKTLTLFELEKIMVTDWPPRAVSEARKQYGKDIIKGDNPYTLDHLPLEVKKPIRYEYIGNSCIPIYQ